MPNHKYKSRNLRRVTAMLLSSMLIGSNLSIATFAADSSEPPVGLHYIGFLSESKSNYADNGVRTSFLNDISKKEVIIADAYKDKPTMPVQYTTEAPTPDSGLSREFYIEFYSIDALGAKKLECRWSSWNIGTWDGMQKRWDVAIPLSTPDTPDPTITGVVNLSTMDQYEIRMGCQPYSDAEHTTPIGTPGCVTKIVEIARGIPVIEIRSDSFVSGRAKLTDVALQNSGTPVLSQALDKQINFRKQPRTDNVVSSFDVSIDFGEGPMLLTEHYETYTYKSKDLEGVYVLTYKGHDYTELLSNRTQRVTLVPGSPEIEETKFSLGANKSLPLKTSTAPGVSSVQDIWVYKPYQSMDLNYDILPRDEFILSTSTTSPLQVTMDSVSASVKLTSEPNPASIEKILIKSKTHLNNSVFPQDSASIDLRLTDMSTKQLEVQISDIKGFNVASEEKIDDFRVITLLPTTPEVFTGSATIATGSFAGNSSIAVGEGIKYTKQSDGFTHPMFVAPEIGRLDLNLVSTDTPLTLTDVNGNIIKIKLRILKVPQLKFEQLSGAKLVETREGGVYNLNVIGTSAAHAPDWPGIPFTITDGYVTRIGESVALPTNLLQTPMTNVPNFYDIYNVGRNKVGSIKVTGEDLLLNMEEYETVNRKIAQAETLAGNTAGSIAEMKRLVALAKLPAEYTQADLRVYVTKATEAQAVIVNVSDLLNKLRDVKIQRDSKEVGTAPGTYPQASMTKLNVVFDRATALSISANPTKKEVADELFAVEQAWNLFLSEVNTVPGLNTTALQAKITECSAITNADKKYTASSFKKLTDKIAAANVVLADKNSTQLTIDTMVTELTAAKAGLVLETGGGVDPGPGPGPDPGPDPGGDGSGSQPTKDNVQLILPPMLNSTYRVGTGVFPTTVTLRLPIESPGVSAAAFAKVGLTSNSPKVKISPAPEKMSRSARAPANYKEYDVTVSLIDDSVVTVPLNVVKDTSAATPEVLYGKTLTLQAVKQEGVPTDPEKPVDPPKPPPEVVTDTWDSDEVIAELQNLKTGGTLELPIDTKYRVGADVFRKLRDKRGSLVLYNDSEEYTFVIKNTDVTGVRPSEVINDFSVQISDTYDRDLRKLFGKTGVVLEFGLSKPGFKSTFGVDTELRKKKLYIYSEVAEDEYEFLCTTTSSNRGLVEFKLTNYDMIVISEKRIPNKYVVNYEDLVAQSGTSGTGGATGEVGTGGSTSNTGNLPTIPVTNPNTGGETAQYVYRGEEDTGSVSPLLAILVFVALSGAGTLGIMEILRIRRKNE